MERILLLSEFCSSGIYYIRNDSITIGRKVQQSKAKTHIYLHMSAKCCTFAAEIVENMSIEEMSHTAWRCFYSIFMQKDKPMRCARLHKDADDKECRRCQCWRASETARKFFQGELHGTHAETMRAIFVERMKKGRF